jgi:predicted alpha/beta hydrolase family esterase
MRYADGPATSVHLLIDAPVDAVWEVVADPALPARTSDELQSAAWTSHVAGAPGVGSTIEGTNRNDVMGEWSTVSHVTAWEPGRRFAWSVIDVEASAARWAFELEPRGDRTVLRQRYRIGPGWSGVQMAIEASPEKEEAILRSRLRNQATNMMRTLVAVKAIAEGGSPRAVRLLLVPGGGGSDPGHWHHAWAAADPRCEWVHQTDPSGGTRQDWLGTLDRAVTASTAPTVLVAHSLATIATSHWARDHVGSVVGALLVGPADVEATWAEPGSLYRRFEPIPMDMLPFPSTLVASTNDPYITVARARELGWHWGSKVEVVGEHGHLGADAALGDWPEGRALLDAQLARLSPA